MAADCQFCGRQSALRIRTAYAVGYLAGRAVLLTWPLAPVTLLCPPAAVGYAVGAVQGLAYTIAWIMETRRCRT